MGVDRKGQVRSLKGNMDLAYCPRACKGCRGEPAFLQRSQAGDGVSHLIGEHHRRSRGRGRKEGGLEQAEFEETALPTGTVRRSASLGPRGGAPVCLWSVYNG